MFIRLCACRSDRLGHFRIAVAEPGGGMTVGQIEKAVAIDIVDRHANAVGIAHRNRIHPGKRREIMPGAAFVKAPRIRTRDGPAQRGCLLGKAVGPFDRPRCPVGP